MAPNLSHDERTVLAELPDIATDRTAQDGGRSECAQLPGLSAARAAPSPTLTARAALDDTWAECAHLLGVVAARASFHQVPPVQSQHLIFSPSHQLQCYPPLTPVVPIVPDFPLECEL